MNETTITLTRQVPVAPERAFQAWVDPAELAQWWWPQWPDTTYDLDVREGGDYRIHSAAVGLGVTGTFTVVDRPDRLVMTWVWQDGSDAPDADVDTVEVRFLATADGTDVRVSHTSTAHVPGGGYEQGWNDVLDRLPGHLAG